MFFLKTGFSSFFFEAGKKFARIKKGCGGLAIIMDFFIVFNIWGKVSAAQIKKIVWIF